MLNVSELRQILDSGGWATVTSGLYAPAAGAGGSGSFGRVVHVFASVDSTNSRARDLAMKGAPGGTVVMAREQTAGRGRHGRVWESEPGKNLLFSIVLRPRVEPELLGLVSLYASVSVAACVEELCGKDAGCKWPNDVTVSGRKICGILSESVITPGGVDAVILGIGLNVNQEDFATLPGTNATSLRLETGRVHDLAGVLGSVLGELERRYRPLAGGRAADIIGEWTRRSVILGSRVCVERGGASFSGIARSVGPDGALRVETAEGTVDVVAGEVHLV